MSLDTAAIAMREYLLLAGAIVMEVTGTTALKFADGFTAPVPSAVVVVGYLSSFYMLSLVLEQLPIGLVYATWAACGILGIAVLGIVLFDESIDLAGVVGMALIVAGVVVLNVLSESYAPAH